jgi:pimeloyl-ACP methyl ester carboxylesterase
MDGMGLERAVVVGHSMGASVAQRLVADHPHRMSRLVLMGSTFSGFLATPDFTDELREVAVPVLLIWGDRDAYATREDQQALLRVMPSARLVTYQGSGHALHWEDPQRVATELVDFIDALGSSR